jgi:hypothetical protein
MVNNILADKTTLQQSHLVACIKTIAESFFDSQGTLVVSLPSDRRVTDPTWSFAEFRDTPGTHHTSALSLLLQTLHDAHRRPIVVSGPGEQTCERIPNIRPIPPPPPDDWDWDTVVGPGPCELYDKQNSYVVWTSDTLRQQLEQLKAYPNAWDPRGRYVVVLEGNSDVATVLEELRQWNILNVVVLIPSRSEHNTSELYSWFPYQPPSGECGKLREEVLLNKCVGTNGHFLRNVSLFPTKLPTDLDGCNVTVSTFPLDPHVIISTDKEEVPDGTEVVYTDGLDIRLFSFMARSLNASVQFLPPPAGDWFDVTPNNTWGGIVGDLLYRRAHIGMCGTTYAFSPITDLDFTVPYDVLDAVWVVPRARQHPRWSSITRVFHLPMWLLLVTVMIMAAGVMLCVSKYEAKYKEEMSAYRSLSGCLSSTWAAMLGVAVARQPDRAPMRLLIRYFFC